MSQQRARKPSGARDAAIFRSSLAKASGDTVPNTRLKMKERSSSKNKIPKSIRYDLENALVGLCDVWFEDIKPHLIRNNIKLHVDGVGAIGLTGCDNGLLPTAAPGCSHLDPGAAPDHRPQWNVNCASCCSMQRTVSRAQYPRHTVGVQTYPLPSLCSLPLTHNSTSQNKKSKLRSSKLKPNKKQTSAPVLSKTDSKYRVPRACRTCIILPSAPSTKLKRIRAVEYRNQLSLHKHSKNYQEKPHWTVDNSNSKAEQIRPKKLNTILRDIGIHINHNSETPNVETPHKVLNKTQRSRNYVQNNKENTCYATSTLFRRFYDTNVQLKQNRSNTKSSKVKSITFRLYPNNNEDCPGGRMQTTNCSVDRIQNFVCEKSKMQSKQRINIKSKRKIRHDSDTAAVVDYKLQQNKLPLNFKSSANRSPYIEIQTARCSECSSQNEQYLNRKRSPVNKIQKDYPYNESQNKPDQITFGCTENEMLQNESTHNNAKDGLDTATRMSGRYFDAEPPTTRRSKIQSIRKRNSESEEPRLFDSGLIDLIVKQQEKRIKILGSNRGRDVPTALNLVTGSPNKRTNRVQSDKKNPPWK